MAYDNGMRIVSPNGKEISVRDMLRKYYNEVDGHTQDKIITKILPSPDVPHEIKSLFEDLYISKGLHGMEEMIKHDVDLAHDREPKDIITSAVNIYCHNYNLNERMTIPEYEYLCKRGDIDTETAKYLQQDYELLGGNTDSTDEHRKYAQGSQKILIEQLSKSLEFAKRRSESLLSTEHSI